MDQRIHIGGHEHSAFHRVHKEKVKEKNLVVNPELETAKKGKKDAYTFIKRLFESRSIYPENKTM